MRRFILLTLFSLGVAALLLMGAVPVLGFAETRLTLAQALDLAKKNNLELQALQKEAQSVEGDLMQAGLIPNPTLDLEQKSAPFLGFREGEQGIFLSQELELGGKRSARLSAAQRAFEEAQLTLSDKGRQLRQQVRTAFYNAWIAQQRLTVLENIVGTQKKFLEVNEARVRLGAIPGLEVKLIKAEHLRSQQKLDEAGKEAQVTSASLFQLLGIPPDPKPVLQLPGSLVATRKDLDSLASEALEQRPDLKALQKTAEKAEAQIRLEKAQAFPNLTVGAGTVWDQVLIEGNEVTPGGIISQIDHRDQLYQIRLSLPLPLFNRNQGNILKAERLRESSLLKVQNLKRTIQTEVVSAWQKVLTSQKIHDRFEHELLPTVKSNLETIEKAYRLGGESILAVLQAQRTLLDTELDYLDNLRELGESMALLESAVGAEWP